MLFVEPDCFTFSPSANLMKPGAPSIFICSAVRPQRNFVNALCPPIGLALPLQLLDGW
jgi:hypothetical protein